MEATKEIVKMLLEFLERVGGLALSEGFRIAVKFVVNEGIAKIGLGVIFLLLSIVCLALATKVYKKGEKNYSEDAYGLTSFLGAVSFLSFVVAMCLFYGGYMRVSAPEWFAVKNLLYLVK